MKNRFMNMPSLAMGYVNIVKHKVNNRCGMTGGWEGTVLGMC